MPLVTEDIFVKGVSLEVFLQRLKAKNVHVVVDVRRSFYRSPPYYPKALKESLNTHGIQHIYESRFGNPYKVTEYPDLEENKRLYQRYIKTEEKELVEEWKKRLREHPDERVALMCWCPTNDPTRCHRFWLQEVLEERANPNTVFVEVRFLKDTPIITGVDMKQYGPFRKGDVAALPKENASVLIKMKVAEKRVKPPTEPTLKEVMKGEVLTGYVEAARVVKVLGEEVMLAGEDTARLADLFLDLLTDAGVSLPSRFKGEFEKAMDIYKPYDENVELIEEVAHRIILRETGKEYPVGEPLRRAREKVERLLKEIREARGE